MNPAIGKCNVPRVQWGAAWLAVALAAALVAMPLQVSAYPLDGYPETGIRRVEGSRLANEGVVPGGKQPPGALLPTQAVQLRLAGVDLAVGSKGQLPVDAEFQAGLLSLLGDKADRYSLVVLDLTDINKRRYAEHRADEIQNVGSVGKLLVGLNLFQALADAWPDDIERRRAVLRNTVITADAFSVSDHHTIRIFDVDNQSLTRRPMQIGDRGSLYEYLDWMLSVSSNSAASMVMRDAMLLHQWGQGYPMADSEVESFFATTPAADLTRLFQATFWTPITRNGLDLKTIRQGSFFTAGGKKKVNGGGNSYASARALLQFMVLMEQGKLVDPWSSLELKRLLYVTERRIRYASSPALKDAAVYSKSGSWWGCQEEAGFVCKPYHGNLRNHMNSVTIVEESQVKEADADQALTEEQDTGADTPPLHYIVVLISNVLRENSAVTHQKLATGIHNLVRQAHGLKPIEVESEAK